MACSVINREGSVLHASVLTHSKSAQTAKLTALCKALELAENESINVFSDCLCNRSGSQFHTVMEGKRISLCFILPYTTQRTNRIKLLSAKHVLRRFFFLGVTLMMIKLPKTSFGHIHQPHSMCSQFFSRLCYPVTTTGHFSF